MNIKDFLNPLCNESTPFRGKVIDPKEHKPKGKFSPYTKYHWELTADAQWVIIYSNKDNLKRVIPEYEFSRLVKSGILKYYWEK